MSITVKAFVSRTGQRPEKGFWQVETSSLRDFPQQFRTFGIYLNSDYTISIETINVDPAVADGTPAATSRKYAIAAQQIIQNDLTANNANIDDVGKAPAASWVPQTRPGHGAVNRAVPRQDQYGPDDPVRGPDLKRCPVQRVLQCEAVQAIEP